MNELNVPAYSPAVPLSYRIRVDGAVIVLEFPLRTDGLPKIAEHPPRAQIARPVPGMFETLRWLAGSPMRSGLEGQKD